LSLTAMKTLTARGSQVGKLLFLLDSPLYSETMGCTDVPSCFLKKKEKKKEN